MYKVTKEEFTNYDENRWGKPLVQLVDEYGGQSVITKDDGCYILLNGSDDREFGMSSWWYPEAMQAITDHLAK